MRTKNKEERLIIRQLIWLIERDGPYCHYCKKLVTRVNWSRDHVVPRALFGPNEMDNLVLAHRTCNNNLNDKIDKCWCEFCRIANEKYLNLGFEKLAAARRTDEERSAIFRAVWTRTDKGV